MPFDTAVGSEPATGGRPRYDELSHPTDGMRPHWRTLIDRLRADESADPIRRSHELTRRLVVENGVTYNVYSDPQGADRPWALDPLPFMLPAKEWSEIEAGVAQRCTLLNAVLADLYGPQRLLSEGLVPPELPFGHPNFLWPCHDLKPVDGTWLHVYAADLARAPDGRWWLLADRTQAPSGAGYALENREILEQVHAEVIPDVGVRRVRGFFDALRERMLTTDAQKSPLAVILTPGPFNETYFEHAYLARQLGMPLVEGNDLTIRGDVLYLKTLAGLRRVHTLLRRLDDDFCDPLELRGDSALGVPGLIGAIRAGNVVVANALGTGVLESAAWLGFLPGISERLLGQKLLLPEVATWWCGEEPALRYVLEHLDDLVIKPTYPNQRFEPMFGRDFRGAAREKLVHRLRTRPYAYVAQERVRLSRAPVWRSSGSAELTSRAITLRVYAIATRDGVKVMPGGLARIAAADEIDVVSAQRGGGAKDLWVLSDVSNDTAVMPVPAGAATTRQNDIPSRLVENLFWLGRYSVRCENKARLLRGVLAARSHAALWAHARQTGTNVNALAPDAGALDALYDEKDQQGLPADVRRLAWCASQIRNRISARYWRVVVSLQRQLQEAAKSNSSGRETCERVLQALAALSGFTEVDMSRDEGWRVMQLGRRIERAQFIAKMLEQQLLSSQFARASTLEWLLDVCDSTAIYRARYLGEPRLASVLDLLLTDTFHPTSLAFQMRAIDSDLEELALALCDTREWHLPLATLPRAADATVLESDSEEGSAARAALIDALKELVASTGELSDRLAARFFAHVDSDAQSLSS
jgi:uncharacterized circularly permuted ATP-grasp superfamily protein/uncharacterized alpha-E superfamily protein